MRVLQAEDFYAANIAASPPCNEIFSVRLADFSDAELMRCVAEAERRGLIGQRTEYETAYEALLQMRLGTAMQALSRALFPDGCDLIKARHGKGAV